METPPAQPTDTKRELYRQFGGPPGLRRPPLRRLGQSQISAGSVKTLLFDIALSKQVRATMLVYYRHERLFRHAIVKAFAASGLPTLIWTDCSGLDHSREGVDVAPAFSVKEPAFFVFDNFQSIAGERNRPLRFLNWNDGEMLPQLAPGSLMLLGVRFASVHSLTVFSPSVMSRCSTRYLASYDRSRAEKEYDQKVDQWQRAQRSGKYRPGGLGAAVKNDGTTP